jgi:signal transduction histidine kinase
MNAENLSRAELIDKIQQLESMNEELKINEEKVREMTKNLLAKISHELKTPLNSIIGFSELLRYKSLDLKECEYVNNILTSSKHMLSLIQDILDVTRSQYKPLELSYSIFNPQEVIEDTIKCFNISNISYTLINQNICADYLRFKQLVSNLISNAIKYNSKDGSITVLTYIDEKYFCFEVSDEGEGISEKNHHKIFDFFSQVSQNVLKRQSGSGIGLSLCKSIVQAHLGEIFVKSELQEGATFVFKIPIDKQEY